MPGHFSPCGIEMAKEEAREIVYGMPFTEWRDKYQTEATSEQKEAFKVSHKRNHGE